MGNEVEELKNALRSAVGMLEALHDCAGWDELEMSLDEMQDVAEPLLGEHPAPAPAPTGDEAAVVTTAESLKIPRQDLAHEGGNPRGVTAEALVTWQGEKFREIRVSAFANDGRCIGDILVGLNEHGELRALVTTDDDGDGDHSIAVYPERPGPMAIEIIEDQDEIARPRRPNGIGLR